MAIQIRRGTNTEWEQSSSSIVAGEPAVTTDTGRFFVGTSTGGFSEFPNIVLLANVYNTAVQYIIGDVCTYKGNVYVCTKRTTGTWDATAWTSVTMSDSVLSTAEYIELAEMLAENYSSSADYFVGQFAKYNGSTYECTTAISGGENWNINHWSLIAEHINGN